MYENKIDRMNQLPVVSRDFWRVEDGKCRIDERLFLRFVNSLGFWVYKQNNEPDNFCYVHTENCIVNKVGRRDIRVAVLDWLGKQTTESLIYNKIAKETKYFGNEFINALPAIKLHILRDNYNTAYFPTKNHIYKVSADNVEKVPYIEMKEGYVWRDRITEKAFNYDNPVKAGLKGHFYKFCKNISGENFEALQSTIGYLLHTYKDPTEPRSVFFYDKNTTANDEEPEGGAGKSLIMQAIQHIRNCQEIAGDRVDFSRQFALSELSESTEIAWLDELDHKMDMKKFFSRQSGALPIEKKNQNVITLTFDTSPKFAFTTNFRPKGSSGSHERRRIDFAIEPYYSSERTPKMEFKKAFFVDWNKEQWDLFFTFYVGCAQLYLQKGIVKQVDKDAMFVKCCSELGWQCAKFWVKDGFLQLLVNDSSRTARYFYDTFIMNYEIDQSEYSLRKYYSDIKKILSLFKIKYTFYGHRENKSIRVLDKSTAIQNIDSATGGGVREGDGGVQNDNTHEGADSDAPKPLGKIPF